MLHRAGRHRAGARLFLFRGQTAAPLDHQAVGRTRCTVRSAHAPEGISQRDDPRIRPDKREPERRISRRIISLLALRKVQRSLLRH